MNQTVETRAAGTSGTSTSTNLLVKPFPRASWAPPPCCHNQRCTLTVEPAPQGTVANQMSADANSRGSAPAAPPKSKRNAQGAQKPNNNNANGAIPKIPLNAGDAKVYTALWRKATNNAKQTFIAAGPASVFFGGSGLAPSQLAVIWNEADVSEPKGQLSQAEFVYALKLIACVQAKMAPTKENALKSTPLPKLGDATVSASAAARSPAPPKPPAKSPGAKTQPIRGLDSSRWVVTPEDVASYKKFFDPVDTDNDGIVSGGEVMGVFMASKLDTAVLAAVWALVDSDNAGYLNLEQFSLAM